MTLSIQRNTPARIWNTTSLIACLALPSLVHASKGAKSVCYDQNHKVIPCPKKPISKVLIIVIIVVVVLLVLGVVGFFLFKVLRKRRPAQKYTALPAPASSQGAHAQGGVYTPAAPGEMGYAGPQPQLTTYEAPQLAYNAPQYNSDKPYDPPAYPPSDTAYAPPPGPPPSAHHAAAAHYGYSAGPI